MFLMVSILKKSNLSFPGCFLYFYVYKKIIIQLSIHSYW